MINTHLVKRALDLDARDPLKDFRDEFLFPKDHSGKDVIYLAGNSLGLQPRKAREYIVQELDDWARLGVEGHVQAKNAWLPYHELVTDLTARLVGALPHEVVVMNSLTVNLHLMMVSFYRPEKAGRHKIIVEAGAFPSDQYAVHSQLSLHGLSRETSLIEIRPRPGESLLRPTDIIETIEREGPELALVLLGNVNYLTGQYYSIPDITRAAHKAGAKVGFDLAHGAGNLHLNLHQDGPDFAVWCNYKYINAGPGAIAGCFVHERHADNATLPRLAGWWGHNKATRFKMGPDFDVLRGAEGWQLSNPPIFQLAALRASLEIFDRAKIKNLRAKAEELNQFFETAIADLKTSGAATIVTPQDPSQRGTQLSLRLRGQDKKFLDRLSEKGVVCDFREPDIIRVAAVPLYTRYQDMARFAEILHECLIQ